MKHWEFKWPCFGQDDVFYRESAQPDDCVRIKAVKKKYHLSALAAIRTSSLINENKKLPPIESTLLRVGPKDVATMNEIACNYKGREKISLYLLVEGLIAYYNNRRDEVHTVSNNNSYSGGLTGRMTEAYNYYSRGNLFARDPQIDRVTKDLEEQKKKRTDYGIIRYFRKK